MANLRETPTWEEGIYQWETSDPVMGGENGIDNKPTRQLANRTLWLKTELAKAVASIGTNKTAADTTLALKADKARTITAGAGLTGGGDLSANRAIALATPSTLSGSTSNWAGNGAIGHTHELAQATATLAGIAKLINNLNSDDGTAALSAKQGNVLSEKITELSQKTLPIQAASLTDTDDLNDFRQDGIFRQTSSARTSVERNYPEASAGVLEVLYGGNYQRYTLVLSSICYERDYRGGRWKAWRRVDALDKTTLAQVDERINEKALPLGAIVGFPKEITSPVGFLKCDGSTFTQATYPDLYQTLGNSNRLPNLNGEIGQVAPFAIDNLPTGWIWFDEIKSKVNQTSYPDLYRLLTSQYGSMDNVPNLDDRFIRNAGNSLTIGQLQDAQMQSHRHGFGRYNANDDIYLTLGNWYAESNVNARLTTGDYNRVSRYTVSGDVALGSENNEPVATVIQDLVSDNTETRPKAIAFKYAIKATNAVNYWIKAYGEVINAGSLNAESLAAVIQEKADKNHTHSYTDITNFNDGVAQLFTYQKIGNFEIRKYPDGTMIQTLKQAVSRNAREYLFTFQWAESFTEMPILSGAYLTETASTDTFISFKLSETNHSKATVCLFENTYHTAPMEVHITAIGRYR